MHILNCIFLGTHHTRKYAPSDWRIVVLRKCLWFLRVVHSSDRPFFHFWDRRTGKTAEVKGIGKETGGITQLRFDKADKHAGRWKADGWSSTRGTNDRFYEMNDTTCCNCGKHLPCKLTSVIKESRRKHITFSVKISTAQFSLCAFCEEILLCAGLWVLKLHYPSFSVQLMFILLCFVALRYLSLYNF